MDAGHSHIDDNSLVAQNVVWIVTWHAGLQFADFFVRNLNHGRVGSGYGVFWWVLWPSSVDFAPLRSELHVLEPMDGEPKEFVRHLFGLHLLRKPRRKYGDRQTTGMYQPV
ncbi:hypothetical protein B0H13DRAFT_1864324 [Mycena leptocephala]|nr:hypothetical protein B0H13DRAFT_1864324 [Mycena leptocephala]